MCHGRGRQPRLIPVLVPVLTAPPSHTRYFPERRCFADDFPNQAVLRIKANRPWRSVKRE